MSNPLPNPARDLWADVDLSAEDAQVSPVAPPVTGDKRTAFPAGEKITADPEVAKEKAKQEAAFEKMYTGEHTGTDEPTEPTEVEGKATVEKRRKAKDGE